MKSSVSDKRKIYFHMFFFLSSTVDSQRLLSICRWRWCSWLRDERFLNAALILSFI